MADSNAVLDEIQREVKKFGDDTKALNDSMRRDLEAVRKLAEDAKSAAAQSPEVKAQIDALTASVAEKNAKIEDHLKAIEKQSNEVAAAVKRAPRGSTDEAEAADEIKGAREFHRISLAVRGELKTTTDVSDARIDFAGIAAYKGAFAASLRRDKNMLGNDEMKALSVGSSPDGGFLVTPQISRRILSIVYESSPLRALANNETISTDALEFPVDDDEAAAGWVGETEDRPTTNTPQVGTQRIPVHEIYAKPKATAKFLEDASINVEDWLARKVSEKFGRTEATAFVSGDGVNKPRGFLSYPSGSTRGKIEHVNSGHATTITSDGLINLMMSLKEFYMSGASWLMRRASVGAVMTLKDTTNQYLWNPAMLAEGRRQMLLGHPLDYAADMPAVGAGALAVAFGNFRQGYTIVDRLGITTLRDPYSAKPFVEFYSRRRVGGDVTNFEAIKLQVISA